MFAAYNLVSATNHKFTEDNILLAADVDALQTTPFLQ
jgi:hypothetical protein